MARCGSGPATVVLGAHQAERDDTPSRVADPDRREGQERVPGGHVALPLHEPVNRSIVHERVDDEPRDPVPRAGVHDRVDPRPQRVVGEHHLVHPAVVRVHRQRRLSDLLTERSGPGGCGMPTGVPQVSLEMSLRDRCRSGVDVGRLLVFVIAQIVSSLNVPLAIGHPGSADSRSSTAGTPCRLPPSRTHRSVWSTAGSFPSFDSPSTLRQPVEMHRVDGEPALHRHLVHRVELRAVEAHAPPVKQSREYSDVLT